MCFRVKARKEKQNRIDSLYMYEFGTFNRYDGFDL